MTEERGTIISARIWYRCSLLLLLSLLAAPHLPAAAKAGTWVRVRPAEASYAQGQSIQVEVWVRDVEDLYGADVRLAFDPAQLVVLDANPSSSGVQLVPRDDLMSPDFVVRNVADNTAGTIWYAATQVNPTEPVSGSGPIVSFTFRALVMGDAPVTVQYQKLVRRDGSQIPAESAGASYEIGEAYIVWLPSVSRNGGTGTAAW